MPKRETNLAMVERHSEFSRHMTTDCETETDSFGIAAMRPKAEKQMVVLGHLQLLPFTIIVSVQWPNTTMVPAARWKSQFGKGAPAPQTSSSRSHYWIKLWILR